MTEEYKKYLDSKEWQLLRQQRLALDDNKCVMCDRPAAKCKSGLNVHHITYKNYRELGVENLVSLCPQCHRKIHKYYNRFRSTADKQNRANKNYNIF